MAKHEIPQLDAQSRERMGSRYAARLRDKGRLPAIIYGHKQDPAAITLDARIFSDVLRRRAHVVNIAQDAKTQSCLVKDVQWNHLGTHIIHVDLARVDLTERVRTEVGLEYVGEPKATQEAGSILEHIYSEIEIECEAGNIPESIRVDLTDIAREKPFAVRDLQLPPGIVCTMDPNTTLAAISFVAEQVEEPVAAEAGPAEPEVIGAKKEEEAAAPAEEKEKPKKEKG